MFGIAPFAAAPFAALGVVDADVQVTGVQGVGQLGSADVAVGYLVTGVQGAVRVGSVVVKANAGAVVSGVVGTGQVGTVQAVNSVIVTGVSATGSVATVSVDADALVLEDSVSVPAQLALWLLRQTRMLSSKGRRLQVRSAKLMSLPTVRSSRTVLLVPDRLALWLFAPLLTSRSLESKASAR